MDELSQKVLKAFPSKVVRKDLTAIAKKGANVPSYVLEYLLGMYCSSGDEETINLGLKKINKILSENYVNPDQSELLKSRIRENGQYTIIDKIKVRFDEKEDKYVASFANFDINEFEVSSSLVIHNEKLLLGGIWCIAKISYTKKDDEFDDGDDLFGDNKKKKKKKEKYSSSFKILNLKPIQMPSLDINEIIKNRKEFTEDEWIDLILRSCGYEPLVLTKKQKFHYLLRIVPMIQKNYNLVELGPRGTGKSHIYSEISPYSILLSGGKTSAANLFYNLSRHSVGLVGYWDCIAFDEVAGMDGMDLYTIQVLKNYMANGSFARGVESIAADASIVMEGNTLRTVSEMLKTSTLFEPFPLGFNTDSAFFDRIHAYLPGWEVPKLKPISFTNEFGLISDCISEFCHQMRKFDFTSNYRQYFTLNSEFNTRDDIAVSKTFSGLEKILFPDNDMTKEEAREILEYSIECRRRVKEQLFKINPSEFKNINLGYIDNETEEEFIVELPEQPKETLIFEGIEQPGFAYAIGRSKSGQAGVYRLENTIIPNGEGKLENKNIEGLSNGYDYKHSINAAFNYFASNYNRIIHGNYSDYDYSLYFNDLQRKGPSIDVSVCEVVALCSAFARIPVKPSLAIVGRVVMSGSMMPLSLSLFDIVNTAKSAGAQKILLPYDVEEEFDKLPRIMKENIQAIYYSTPLEAAKIALGID